MVFRLSCTHRSVKGLVLPLCVYGENTNKYREIGMADFTACFLSPSAFTLRAEIVVVEEYGDSELVRCLYERFRQRGERLEAS